MGWVRIDDNAPHHQKQLAAGPAACWLWVCAIAYCQRTKSDGFIPLAAMPLLGVGSWRKLAARLVTARMFDEVEGGYRVHDYLEWNPSRDEREEKAEQTKDRKRRWRDKHREELQGNSDRERVPETQRERVPGTLLPSHPIPSHPIQERAAPSPRPHPASPLAWERRHGTHEPGFCAWVCLPSELVEEFSGRLPASYGDGRREAVLVWARGVREAWADRVVGDESHFAFWKARWQDTHGTTKARPVAAKDDLSEVIAELNAKEARR